LTGFYSLLLALLVTFQNMPRFLNARGLLFPNVFRIGLQHLSGNA